MPFEENNTMFEFKEAGDFIEGRLIKIQENMGPQNSMLYSLETKVKDTDRKQVNSVWGSQVLDQKMIGIVEGDVIKIIYDGLGVAKPGQNAAKIFRVLVDRK